MDEAQGPTDDERKFFANVLSRQYPPDAGPEQKGPMTFAPPPYVSTARAGSAPFSIDYERLTKSEEWVCADASVRPCILGLRLIAWRQVPCGSLPPNDLFLAQSLELTPYTFARIRQQVLHGWRLADDGRLYHPEMTKDVQRLLRSRKASNLRQARAVARRKSKAGENN
jgi:hypothetical protein